MRKIGIGNFQLPATNGNKSQSISLIAPDDLAMLKNLTSAKVFEIALRALDRAGRYDSRHPFWNGLADCYLRIGRRIRELADIYPDITRVIHNSEVKKGDVLVSDFHIGMNLGFMNGGMEPVRIRTLEVDGDVLKGEILGEVSEKKRETGYFRNELWFFESHRFKVYSSANRENRHPS